MNPKVSFEIIFIIILMIQFTTTHTSAHQMRDIETLQIDITPQLKEGSYRTKLVTIDSDSTTIPLGSVSEFTTQHLMIGYMNFSNIILEYDGLEAYKAILHQKIYLQDTWIDQSNDELELGRRSKILSDSALHDGQLSFVYNLRNLDDLTWSPYIQVSDTKKSLEDDKNRDIINYRLETSIEFIRSTKQNGHFEMSYGIDHYTSQDIPQANFHYRQEMNTSLFPNSMKIEDSSVQGASEQVFLFIPDEMVPKYFHSSAEHKLNLTEIPLTINLKLELSNKHNYLTRLFKIENDFYFGTRTNKDEFSEEYKLVIMLSKSPLIPIRISTLGYTGEIKITANLELRSLFADTGLYAKFDYLMSPNQYLLIISFTATVFVYKMVDYVEYRIFQNKLGYIDNDLVAEEFLA